MKKLFSYSLFVLFLTVISCDSQEEIQPILEDEPGIPKGLLGCFLTQTNPADGNCPGVYHLTAPLSSSYSWVVSGDAYIAVPSSANTQSISVIPQRQQWHDGSFWVSLTTNEGSCGKDFFVLREIYCQ